MRFGIVHLPCGSQTEFAAAARRCESLGFDFLAAPDHLGSVAPFAALVAAGMLTMRIRLRTYVLNVGFWNPALLVREALTADLLTNGRLELGLGAGHMKAEFEDAGIRWGALEERVERLEMTAREVRRRLAGRVEPRPVQQPLPLVVGAMSRLGLAVAAEHADIVSFAGLRQLKSQAAGTFTVATSDETDELVSYVNELRSGRPFEADMLLQVVRVGVEPEHAARQLAHNLPGVTPQRVLDSPFVLFAGTAEAAAVELERRRERWGFESITTFWSSVDDLYEVRCAMQNGS